MLPEQIEHHLALAGSEADDRLQERRTDEQDALSRLGMHAHDRMLGLQLPAADALVVGLALGGAGGRLEPMDAAQPVNDATHRLRETLIGHREIGPERVAAVGRNGHAAQDGSLGRVQRGGDVGMPPGPRSLRARPTIGLRRAELGDRVDLGEILDMAEHGVADGRLAHLSRKGNVGLVIEVLTPEEDDLPAQESLVDCFPRRRVERSTEIDARDLGADVQRERLHLERTRQLSHGRLLDDMSRGHSACIPGYLAASPAALLFNNAAASLATAVPSKKRGFCVPQSRTALPNTKSWKSLSVMSPSSTSSNASGSGSRMSTTSKCPK